MMIPEVLGREKSNIFIHLGDGLFVLYLVWVNGVQNWYNIEPIVLDPWLERGWYPVTILNTREEEIHIEVEELKILN